MSSRTPTKLSSAGPYLAEVTNHLDKSGMGGLEVILKTRIPADANNKSNTYFVKYMTPFYGVTSHRFLGNDLNKFGDTQKSYGMWMVPPDVGTTVMVIFVDSDPNQGYWIGCVPDLLQNHMVPGIAASENFRELTQQQKTDYKDALVLPVAEYNKKNSEALPDINSAKRPVHPFADVLFKQGLLLDNIRGVTSSSARREQPSMVFGISTPGPLDTTAGAPTGTIGYGENDNLPTRQFPVSRLGGSTFVMDDGDVDGNNELVRIRTRTGHQILMHNTADLIYIANAKGTAWLEFTGDGKIDIYAADSVSIHTQGDFNFKADRDFNLHAGRNFNVFAESEVNLNANGNLNSIGGNILTSTPGNLTLSVGENNSLFVGGNNSQLTTGRVSISSEESVAIEAKNEIALYTTATIAIDALRTREYPGSRTVAAIEPAYDIPAGINLFTVPTTTAAETKDAGMLAAMSRVPMREPWSQHESLNQGAFSLSNTDSSAEGTGSLVSATTPGSSRSITPNIKAAPSSKVSRSRPGVDVGVEGTTPKPWTTDQAFLNKVKSVAKGLKINPIDLIGAMNLETVRTFNPAIPNPIPGSSAVGLIQFTNGAIKTITAGKQLKSAPLSYLSRVQQMDWVDKYFLYYGWGTANATTPTLTNVYMTIFLPAYRFKDDSFVVSKKGEEYYNKNTSFDSGSPPLGYITVGMIAKTVKAYKNDAILTLKNAGLDENLDPIK